MAYWYLRKNINIPYKENIKWDSKQTLNTSNKYLEDFNKLLS